MNKESSDIVKLDAADYYQKMFAEIENWKQTLKELKNNCLDTRVTCALLELKLCTCVDPSLAEAVKEVHTECQECVMRVKGTTDMTKEPESDNNI